MTERICIYHHPCLDGYTAAWAVYMAFGNAFEYYPANHGDAPPDVTGKDVLMVDFSYKRDIIETMAHEANSILILDHHASAERELKGFREPEGRWPHEPKFKGYPPAERVRAIFDMDRSGARLAWDYFHPTEQTPELLLRVEDRDLWRFAYPDTKTIHQALASHDYDFVTWSRLMYGKKALDELRQEGAALERKLDKDLREMLPIMRRHMTIGGYDVPVASLPYTMVSEAAHKMAKQAPFAACYWDLPDKRTFGLRSVANGMDVSKIAQQYGGGGHVHAAGFSVDRSHRLAQA